jgi:RNA polymerase sporulation-specific sigma factor
MGSCADDAPITFAGMLDEEVVIYAKNGSDRAVDYLLQKYRSLVESKARLYFLVGAITMTWSRKG